MPSPSLTLDTPELAKRYEEVSAERQFRAGQALIAELKVTPGERALDVGCGTGLLADYVAGVVGPTGSVTGFDPLPLRIELAKKRARSNVAYFVGNALDLSLLPADSFDVVYLNAVFHWIPDKALALRNFFRVLRPGGRVGITTGSKDHTNVVQEILRRVLAKPPYDKHPEASSGASQRVSALELRQLLVDAGFTPELLEVRPNASHQASADDAIEFSQASSFGNFLGHLPPALAQTARAEIARELEKTRTPEGIPQQGARLFAVAQKSLS